MVSLALEAGRVVLVFVGLVAEEEGADPEALSAKLVPPVRLARWASRERAALLASKDQLGPGVMVASQAKTVTTERTGAQARMVHLEPKAFVALAAVEALPVASPWLGVVATGPTMEMADGTGAGLLLL